MKWYQIGYWRGKDYKGELHLHTEVDRKGKEEGTLGPQVLEEHHMEGSHRVERDNDSVNEWQSWTRQKVPLGFYDCQYGRIIEWGIETT